MTKSQKDLILLMIEQFEDAVVAASVAGMHWAILVATMPSPYVPGSDSKADQAHDRAVWTKSQLNTIRQFLTDVVNEALPS